MNSLINTLFNTIDGAESQQPFCKYQVTDSGDVYKTELELSGFSKKDVKVKILDDVLHVVAKNKERSKKFKLHLNNAVSEEHVTAELKYGLLKLTLPKRAIAGGKEIEIKT